MSSHRQCVIPACTRHAHPGSLVCRPHRRTRAAREWHPTIRQAAADADHALTAGEASAAAHHFRRRVAHGEYGELFDPALGRILAQAAAQAGLNDELGAVRFTLARLLAEERDPSQMALGVARLVRAAVAVSRERRELHQQQPHPLTAAMSTVLAELVPLRYPTPDERSLG